VGLELELTYAPSLEPRRGGSIIPPLPASSSIIGLPIPVPTFTNGTGRAVIFSNNVRVAVPTTSARLEPFFVAGGGVASVRQTADLRYTFPTISGGFPGPLVLGTQTLTERVTTSTVGLALTLGGGVGIKATEHLWIADLRLIRVIGDRDQDQNVGRFGAAARYRF
jgi:hypothetical protein